MIPYRHFLFPVRIDSPPIGLALRSSLATPSALFVLNILKLTVATSVR